MHHRSALAGLGLAFVALLTPGCFLSRNSVNVPLHAEKLAQLTPGQSTQAEVLTSLGAPIDVVQLGFRTAWRYDYTVEKRAGLTLFVITLINTDVQQDRLWLFFDEKGVLAAAGSTIDADKAVYELPWTNEHAQK